MIWRAWYLLRLFNTDVYIFSHREKKEKNKKERVDNDSRDWQVWLKNNGAGNESTRPT